MRWKSLAGTKLAILELLLREELSAAQLAQRLDITPAGVRQHLTPLFASGLVGRRRVGGDAWRPSEVYHLTDAGRRVFPKQYALLLGHLVDAIAEREGPEQLERLVGAAARRLVEALGPQVAPSDDRAARWARVVDWLETDFGWQAVPEDHHGERRLVVRACPLLDVAATRPVVCGAFFATLIRTLLDDSQVVHQPIREGPVCCAFTVKADAKRSPA